MTLVAEERYCANPQCLVRHWSVTLKSAAKQVWRIVAYFDDTPFLVAAPTPICPCCGDRLLTSLEFEDGFADQPQNEEGPLFDFIRQLP